MFGKIINTVSKVPVQTSLKKFGSGMYFVKNDLQKGLYVVSPFSDSVHKIFDTLDYKTKKETDDALATKASQKEVEDHAKSIDILSTTKADKSVVDALASGVIRQNSVETYSTGTNSLSAIYGLTANNNGSNGIPKEKGWDVLVLNDETKGGTDKNPKSNRYNWNGTAWIDMNTGLYDDQFAPKVNSNDDLVVYTKTGGLDQIANSFRSYDIVADKNGYVLSYIFNSSERAIEITKDNIIKTYWFNTNGGITDAKKNVSYKVEDNYLKWTSGTNNPTAVIKYSIKDGKLIMELIRAEGMTLTYYTISEYSKITE